jgi:hypothetical protein
MYSVTNVAGLISAIDAANQNADPDTIVLAAGTSFVLTDVNSSTAHGSTGLPIISGTGKLTIIGNGSIIERSAAADTPAFRLIDVDTAGLLALENLTLRGGKVVGTTTESAGGAIYNQGTLTLSQVNVMDSVAEGQRNTLLIGSPPQSTAVGGGIYSSGALSIEGGFIQNNQAIGGVGAAGRFSVPGGGASDGSRGAHGLGGGLYVGGGTAILNHVNLTWNAAHGGDGGAGRTVTSHGTTYGTDGGAGGNGFGGSLYAAAGTITLQDSIATNNLAVRGEGGLGGAAPGGQPGTPGAGRGGGLRTNSLTSLDEFTLADGAVIVGFGRSASGSEAFLWDATHGMRSLRDVLVNDLGLGATLTGWTLTSANDISADGQFIVGSGINPSGNLEAWLAHIEPQSTLLGDFNNDGTVDAADYVVWRKTDGTQAGYVQWRANFGATSGAGSAAGGGIEGATVSARLTSALPISATIPEPVSIALAVAGFAGWNASLRRRK